HYENGVEMMKALAKSFKCPEDSAFFGSFDILNVPEIPDRDRVQLVTYEIWRATGYRFTIKDHPQTKTGHTTRFWCSQDVHRKYRQTLNVVSRMIKNRFPCRSRLLVSSRDTETPGYRRVTMRMYHRFPHEPYTETQRIWPVGSSLGPSPSWMGSVEEEDRVRVATNAVHPHSYTPLYPNHPIHANPLVTIGQLQSNLMTPTSDPGLAYFNQISHSNPGNLTSFPSPSPGPPTVASASGLTSVSASASASPVLPISTETFQRKMHTYIRNIRDFCDGLEYQLQFNDLRMLQELEEKGNGFLEYVKTCLEREGRLKSDQSQDETGA
ncbi:hypothetical protein F5879DRAFT_797718, partial [Lentinula edodes]